MSNKSHQSHRSKRSKSRSKSHFRRSRSRSHTRSHFTSRSRGRSGPRRRKHSLSHHRWRRSRSPSHHRSRRSHSPRSRNPDTILDHALTDDIDLDRPNLGIIRGAVPLHPLLLTLRLIRRSIVRTRSGGLFHLLLFSLNSRTVTLLRGMIDCLTGYRITN